MTFFEKLYKATADAKRALLMPSKMAQTKRLLDGKVREYEEKREDADGELQELYIKLVEADKDGQKEIFDQIISKEEDLTIAKNEASIAQSVKDKLFAENKV